MRLLRSSKSEKEWLKRYRRQVYWLVYIPMAIILGGVLGIGVYLSPNPAPNHPIIAGGMMTILIAVHFGMLVWMIEGGWRVPACFAVLLAWNCFNYGWQSLQCVVISGVCQFELLRWSRKTVSHLPSENGDSLN